MQSQINRHLETTILGMFKTSILAFLWIFISFCGRVESDPNEVFLKNKLEFKKVAVLRDTLQHRYPSCYSLKFTVTAKSFWQECDSVKPNPDLPAEFLSNEEKEFLSGFMHKCGMVRLKMGPSTIRFIFAGDKSEIVRTDTAYSAYKAYELDNLFYLLPSDVKKPE